MKPSGWDAYNFTDDDEQSIRLDVEEILIHPLFNYEIFDYDVALLRLSRPVDLVSIDASPICLPSVGDTSDFVGNIGIISGWGAPQELASSTTRILQKLEVPIQNVEDCIRIMDYFLHERMICAGIQEGGQDACKVTLKMHFKFTKT
jgi:trypsin